MLSHFVFNVLLNTPLGKFRLIIFGLKWNGAQYLLAYADDVNILGGSVHTIKVKAQASVLSNKETIVDMLIKLCTFSCIDNRMLDEMSVYCLIIIPSKNWFISKHGEQNLKNFNCYKEEIESRLKSENVAVIWCRIYCFPLCYTKT